MNRTEASLVDDSIRSPRYAQVYSALYQWIAQGHYSPGDQLESENRLCAMFGVSRITVRKAMEMLVNEGMVSNAQGKGNFVRSDYVNTALRGHMADRISTARKLARNSRIRDLQIECTTSADASIDLKCQADAPLTRVSYVRELNNEPVGFVESWFPDDLPITLNKRTVKRSTMLTILEDQGISLSGIDHLVGATLADAQLAHLLNINAGTPLVRVKMVMLDTIHRAVETVRGFFRADRYEHHMFMTRTTTEREL